MIRSEKLRGHQYREGYARSLEWKRVEWVKRAMVESVREVCVPVRVGKKNPKSVWWNDEIKATVMGKEDWKLVMKMQKKDVWKLTNMKRDIYISERKR